MYQVMIVCALLFFCGQFPNTDYAHCLQATSPDELSKKVNEFLKYNREKQLKEVKKSKDQVFLAEIINLSGSWPDDIAATQIQKEALARVTDQSLLSRIAKARYETDNQNYWSSWDVRREAVSKVNDDNLLMEITSEASSKEVRAAGLAKISNQEFLIQFAKATPDKELKLAATRSIKDPAVRDDILLNTQDPKEEFSMSDRPEPSFGGKTLSQWVKQFKRLDRRDTIPGKLMSYERESSDALVAMGRDSLPGLENLLGSSDWDVRYGAVQATYDFDPQIIEVVPLVIRVLREYYELSESKRNPIAFLKDATFDTLAKYGPAAKDAVPFCIKALESYPYNDHAMELLAAIGPDAKDAVGILIKELQQETRYDTQRLAARALGRIGPEARDALPALQKKFDNLKYADDGVSNMMKAELLEAILSISGK